MAKTVQRKDYPIPQSLAGVAAFQVIEERLDIPPIHCGRIIGFSEPIDISGCFTHVGLLLLDGQMQPVGEIHGLAVDKKGNIDSVGRNGSRLQLHMLKVGERPGCHVRRLGKPISITASGLTGGQQQLLAYMRASHRHKEAYGVPADIVRNKLKDFRRNFKPVTEAGKKAEIVMKPLRTYVCGALVALPLWMFAPVVSFFTGWPIRVRGVNSNAAAADAASFFGSNLRAMLTHEEAPLIHRQVKRWLKAATRPARRALPAPLLLEAA